MDRHDQDTSSRAPPRRWREWLRSVALPSSFVIWIGTGLLSSIFLGLVLWSSLQSYHRTIAAAEASVQNIALIHEALRWSASNRSAGRATRTPRLTIRKSRFGTQHSDDGAAG